MISNNIKKFVFGNPINTGAVVKDIDTSVGVPKEFEYDRASDSFSFSLESDDAVYGLGETVRGINKRGWIYVSNNSDDPHHEETKSSLYASQNFLIIDNSKRCFGIFIILEKTSLQHPNVNVHI